jgi:hypothetical protein
MLRSLFLGTGYDKLPRSELSPIINNDVVRHAKYVYDFFDEFHCLGRCDRGSGLYFNLLHELIHCDEDMCESIFIFLEQTSQIQPPCGERTSNGYSLQLM